MNTQADALRFFSRLIFLCCVFSFSVRAFSNPAPTNQSIPWTQVGANATAQYSGDGLGVLATPGGAQLRCVLQKLEGEVTAEGLSLSSTVPDARDQLQVNAARIGRDGGQSLVLDKQGAVQVVDAHARYVRPGLIEEYSVTADGIRQDFLVTQSPAGPGPLRLHLTLRGARAETSPDGAQLVLNESGRKLNYNRLRVTDATGRELAAWMEIAGKSENPKSKMEFAVVVEDAGALYPLRIDPTFSDANWISMGGIPGAGGGTNGPVHAAVVDGLGNLYIGGSFKIAGDVFATNIAKWNGSSWSALGSGIGGVFFSGVLALAVSGSDLYVGGVFANAGGIPATNIAKWDGSTWSALGSGMNGSVGALAVSGSDLYAGGSFTTAGGSTASRIAKWNGTIWTDVGLGMESDIPFQPPYVYALAVSGTDLYAGGTFTRAGGSPATNIAKWNGSTWSVLGSGMNNIVFALAVSGSDLYAGGIFTRAGGSPANYIAKWNGSSWSPLGSGMNWYPRALAISGSDLYAGGDFTTAGGSPANYIAKWNGSSWSTLNAGLGGSAYALAVLGSDLYAAGGFISPASRIAKWNGSSWSVLGSAGMGGVTRPYVAAWAVSGSDLYAGGWFTTAGGSLATNIAKWNGSTWSGLGMGFTAPAGSPYRGGRVNAVAILGTELYVGGGFTMAGGSPATNIAKWDGSAWSALGSGMGGAFDPSVYALVVSGSDLYAGGGFTTAGGVAASGIAKWNGTNWSALGSGLGGSAYPFVNALAVSGSVLYAGGSFTTAGGSSANYIAKWNGSTWSALGSGMGGVFPNIYPFVYALAVSGSNLYSGGAFTIAGGGEANYIAKWNGSSWSALGGGMNGTVSALALSGTELYAGGGFTTAGGTDANGIAKWNGSSWSALGSGMNGAVGELAVSESDLYVGGVFTTAGGKVSACVAKARIASAAESITASGSSATIQFSGIVGYEYHVQRTSSLIPPMTWTTLTTSPLSPADDGSLTFTDTTAPPGTAYYRLVEN